MLIPKILHYIWLGSRPMPPLMEQWRFKWSRLHPGWQIKVWKEVAGEAAQPSTVPRLIHGDEILESRLPTYLMKCPTIAKRSNVWRYDLLERLGGVYLDTDFEPIKNIEPLIEDSSAFAGLCVTKYGWSKSHPEGKLKTEIGCSIIGATENHPWLQDLFNNIEKQDLVEPLSLAFPYITKITLGHPGIHLFKPDVFYSVRWDEPCNRTRIRHTPPEDAYAVHRWSSWWFNNGLNPLFPREPEKQPMTHEPEFPIPPEKRLFTSNWFGPMASAWMEHVVPHIKKIPDAQWLEVGSYEGRSALWAQEHMLHGDNARVTCVDIWDANLPGLPTWGNVNYESLFDANTRGNSHILKLKGKAEDILPTLGGKKFHGAYLDSSHTEESVLAEARLIWKLLLPDAIFVLDDYGSPQHPGVKKSADIFLAQPDVKHTILHRAWQLIVIKT